MSGPARAAVDVSIPTLDRPGLLVRAVSSALSQQGVEVAVTVVDNGSGPSTRAALDALTDPRLQVVRHDPTIPRTENYNVALAAGSGRYVAILADDDEWLPGFAQRTTAVLEADPGVVLVHTGYETIDLAGRRLSSVVRPAPGQACVVDGRSYVEWLLRGRHRLEFTATVLRRSALPEGGFRTEDDGTDDIGLLLRTAMRGRVAVVAEPLVRIRIHEGTVSAAVSTATVAGGYQLSTEYRERGRATKRRFLAEHQFPPRTRRRLHRLADRALRTQLLVPAVRALRTTGSPRHAWRRAAADVALDPRCLVDPGAWKRALAAALARPR